MRFTVKLIAHSILKINFHILIEITGQKMVRPMFIKIF